MWRRRAPSTDTRPRSRGPPGSSPSARSRHGCCCRPSRRTSRPTRRRCSPTEQTIGPYDMHMATSFQRARSDEQRALRSEAILDTAAAMLDEMPVSDISLNELSRRVGLAKSNVVRYFDSREDVLLELLTRSMREWLAGLAADLPAVISR